MAASVEPGTAIAGYSVERLIGAGGMGVVYLAREEELGRPVALKLLAPELAADASFRARLLEEMRIAASLEHPHVCPVYAAGEQDGVLYLVLRFVEGEDAAALVVREGPLAPERALTILRDVAGALDHAHDRGLLHRDVKPQNVLLDAAGNAYLSDFGLARPLARGEDTDIELAGTLSYLAPELIEDDPPSPASDAYALACLAYFLLTGEPPFVRSHEAALLFAHLRDSVPSLENRTLARLDPVFARALAKRPEERYGSCGDLVQAFLDAHSKREPSAESWPAGLPRPRTSFLGRERELEELDALVGDGARLVTLTGPGGAGKTRLGLELALRLAPRYDDATVWVALAAIADPELLLPQIASALGAPDTPIEETIGDGAFLLCLDNLEQLLPQAARDVSRLLDGCPKLTLLCTSRSPLHIEGEVEYRVPPLDESEAVALFLERAAGHVESREIASAAPEICVRLDCLPLAVELASARLRLLTPKALLARLDARLPLLTTGPRDAPERQRTLAATLDWSYGLLDEPERTLLPRLSVFQGGFTLEAAEAVCAAELEPLAGLLDASLVRRRGSAGADARFDLLAVIREYAAGKLDGREHAELLERHAAFYAELAERARESDEQELWSRLVLEELPNIRAALTWAADNDQARQLAGVVGRLGQFWYQLGLGAEAHDWAERALAALDLEPCEERAGCLAVLGLAAWARGDFAASGKAHEESAAMYRVLGNKAQLSRQLRSIGVVALELDDLDRATEFLEESAATAREAGDGPGELTALGNLAVVASRRSEHERAAELYEEVAAAAKRIHDDANRAFALSNVGIAREQLGQYEDAEPALVEALALLERLGWKEGLVYTLAGLARVALALDEPARAARLLSAAERLGESIGLGWQGKEAERHDETLAALRATLGSTFESTWTEATTLTPEDVVARESRSAVGAEARA